MHLFNLQIYTFEILCGNKYTIDITTTRKYFVIPQKINGEIIAVGLEDFKK
jgi:hypothetical protein